MILRRFFLLKITGVFEAISNLQNKRNKNVQFEKKEKVHVHSLATLKQIKTKTYFKKKINQLILAITVPSIGKQFLNQNLLSRFICCAVNKDTCIKLY